MRMESCTGMINNSVRMHICTCALMWRHIITAYLSVMLLESLYAVLNNLHYINAEAIEFQIQ